MHFYTILKNQILSFTHALLWCLVIVDTIMGAATWYYKSIIITMSRIGSNLHWSQVNGFPNAKSVRWWKDEASRPNNLSSKCQKKIIVKNCALVQIGAICTVAQNVLTNHDFFNNKTEDPSFLRWMSMINLRWPAGYQKWILEMPSALPGI